ncbi:MAG: FKBP-type peptidyl-prolyl cis-trans isomerase [Paludibacteraceae bacterium]|nr:FKBP-type peptidyl-prolyl cis-trans isomerase [Paludibacteraceae bacterium]MBN2787769.1 FKBP-type peptidyl-prolyl cis-trans isomerase [Paludibacteraceae bacterium]
MKKRNSLLLIIACIITVFASCSDDYADTKKAGEDYLADLQKKGNVDLYQTVYDTTIIANDSIVAINSQQVFYKNVPINTLPNNLNYAVFWNNTNGIYPVFADASDLIVEVKYTVYFIDGSIYKAENRDPILITISNQTESLWKEVIPKMRIGSKWRVWAPYDKAFKVAGFNEKSDGSFDIDPYTLLIYDIELLNVY